MSYTVREGVKVDIAVKAERTRGTGAITLTSPERRIVDASRALVSGFDWSAALWDDVNKELYALFDSTVAALSTPATYYMQLRAVFGLERYGTEVRVDVVEWGP